MKETQTQQYIDVESLDFSKLSTCSCIVIDGDNGAGKSTLAKELARRLGAKVVSLDEHLAGNRDIYWDQIDYESLRRKIFASGPRVIIEGVCALKVLAAVNVPPDYHIFLKLINGTSDWEPEHFLGDKTKPPTGGGLFSELVRYYRQFRPFEASDVILHRCI